VLQQLGDERPTRGRRGAGLLNDVEVDLRVNEVELVLCQTGTPHPRIQLYFGWRHGGRDIVVERLRVPQPCKTALDRVQVLRKARTHKSEARVDSHEFSVALSELSDDLTKFSRRDIVVLHLYVYPRGACAFLKADVDIAGAFMEQLMKGWVEKPNGKLAHRVSRLKSKPLARRDAAHRLRRQ
jgi:hypothetical protein